MTLRTYRTFQALILAALGIFLITKIYDGRILFYINQRFVILVLLAAVGFIALAQVVLRARPAPGAESHSPDADEQPAGEHDHEHGERPAGWVLWLVALPLLIGLLVPERPLGTSVLDNRGINTGAGLSVREGDAARAVEIPSTQRSVLDWIRAYNQETPSSGEPADVTGFVYHDGRLEDGYFMVGRFSIACCVADAVALGMVVAWPEAATLPDNRWVRVRGVVTPFELDGRTLPLIEARQVELIPDPEQPYLFP